LRMVTLSICVLLTVLSVLSPVLVVYVNRVSYSRTVSLGYFSNLTVRDNSAGFVHEELRESFPIPLEAVNSQALSGPVQVGAWGDEASVGNMGVQVEIQTNAYNVSSQGTDAFWVGDVLSDGTFVQFGYIILSSGYYCVNGHVTSAGTSCLGDGNIGYADARWFWSYFPNARDVTDWYYEFGSANSAGYNGTWHLYSIQPSASGDWAFVMDGVLVFSSNFPVTVSTSPAHLVAEKASGPYLSQLGPVEFRDLAYFGNSLWHAASSLTLIDGCGLADGATCTFPTAYGVELAGPNDVIAGSGIPLPESDQLVW
jgi:hypothetical protein